MGLYAILSCSCLTAVPLLNWSSTLRNLHTVSGTSSIRTILISWISLVTVGLLCVLVSIETWAPYHWYPYELPGVENVTYKPNGEFNLSAGHSSMWKKEFLVVDIEFIQGNQCSDPCSASTSPNPRFRNDSDLIGLKMKDYELFYSYYTTLDESRDSRGIRFLGPITQGIWCISCIVTQGIWCVCFESRSPLQVRNLFYVFFRTLKIGGSNAGKKMIAKYIAVLAQLWAILILVSCPVVFIFNIVTIEMFISFYHESDPPIHVGA